MKQVMCEHMSTPAFSLENTEINLSSAHSRKGDNCAGILTDGVEEARRKLAIAMVPERLVATITALGPKNPVMMAALIDRACSDDTSMAIARRYSVHESTLSLWIRRIGLPARRRGRPVLKEPTSEHQRILELVRIYGGAEAARRCSISKQWISRVVHKWEPQLGRRRTEKTATVRPTVRRLRRNFIVSFRMTEIEWDRLLAAQVTHGDSELSGPNKARAIILHHIAPSGGDGCKLTNSSLGFALGNTGTEVANVHTQTAA